jgi:hypothetical protein
MRHKWSREASEVTFGSRSNASLVLKAEKPLNAADELQILDGNNETDVW